MIRPGRITVLTLLAAGMLAAQAGGASAAIQKEEKLVNVAHRGASGYAPENTMAAFEKSVEMKADYLELDVQLSQDGRLVVIHDTTVDRTTDGTGLVGSLTFDQLRQLDAGSFFSEAFKGEKIPSLEEVLDAYRGRIGILIEIKASYLYPGIEEKVAAALRDRDMDKPNNAKIIVQSFEFESVKKFHALLPDIPVGVLTSGYHHLTDAMLTEFSTYADYINPNLAYVNAELVERVHRLGMGVMAWTVRNRSQVQPLLDAGVDGIITDYPDYVPRVNG
ncbi:glycerophosphodiester phosphodiesterase [Paenibacillus sp. sptzw28]|uniref:glycerophosphodiester phosphodiesterase n=1 Tax=Paenibacillus sp. sptzw28 TaxID=715179 RepID=UPI001C6E6F50|nr:glycerophosphodiester phosphodiesterase [Paenibacillus sp. sptzw28]